MSELVSETDRKSERETDRVRERERENAGREIVNALFARPSGISFTSVLSFE